MTDNDMQEIQKIFNRPRPTASRKDFMIMKATCSICKIEVKVMVKKVDFKRWQDGANIQNVWPHLTPDTREIFISNTCGKCFDALFKEEE